MEQALYLRTVIYLPSRVATGFEQQRNKDLKRNLRNRKSLAPACFFATLYMWKDQDHKSLQADHVYFSCILFRIVRLYCWFPGILASEQGVIFTAQSFVMTPKCNGLQVCGSVDEMGQQCLILQSPFLDTTVFHAAFLAWDPSQSPLLQEAYVFLSNYAMGSSRQQTQTLSLIPIIAY